MKKRIIMIALAMAVFLLSGCTEKKNRTESQENSKPSEETSNSPEKKDYQYLKVINEGLGFELEYPSDILTYDYSKELNTASFMNKYNGGKKTDIFLAISTSEYNEKDTIEGLKLQAFSENIKEEEVSLGKDKIKAIKIAVSDDKKNGRVANYYVYENINNSKTYLIEVDFTPEDKDGVEDYLNEFGKMIDSYKLVNKEISSKQEIKNMAMGFSLFVSSDFNSELKSYETETLYLDEFKSTVDKKVYYALIDEVKQQLFTIYRIPKESINDGLNRGSNSMIFLGEDKNASFFIDYNKEPYNSLSEEGKKEYYDIMNSDVYNIVDNFKVDVN